MLKNIRTRLTAANVLAAIAVFAALGGGVAWALKANSVKSRHIKNGEVKPQDLNVAAKPLGFSYLANTGDDVQAELLNAGGYRITAACENSSGEPSLEFFMDFPQDGRIAGHVISDTSTDPAIPDAGAGAAVDADVVFDAGALTAAPGESATLGATFTYVGQTKSASVNLHALADDDDDQCRFNGMLIPGVMAAG